MQKGIAEKIIRFHVIANSDEDADQALKLQVRNCVGAYVSTLLKDARDKDETVSLPIAKDQMREIGSMNGKRLQEWPSRRNGEA